VETKVTDNPATNGTILLVDDEAFILDLTCDFLNRYGYTPITAASGEEAIEIYKRQGDQIDLVFLDIEMPGMGGARCFNELHAINSRIKIIIATGYPAIGKIKETFEAGAAGFICKPYRSADMAEKIRKVLDRG